MKHFITPFLNRLLHFQRESGRDRQRVEEGTWKVSLTMILATKTGEQVQSTGAISSLGQRLVDTCFRSSEVPKGILCDA